MSRHPLGQHQAEKNNEASQPGDAHNLAARPSDQAHAPLAAPTPLWNSGHNSLFSRIGCANGGPSNPVAGTRLTGSVFGGHNPVSGSLIQLYADSRPSRITTYSSNCLKCSIRGEVNKKHFAFGRIFVGFQPRLYEWQCQCG
jgi:hypothetical protein